MKTGISHGKWLDMWGTKTEDAALTAIYEDLIIRYSEAQRHYHNLDHIEACLEEFNEVNHSLTHPFETWLALWFHDAVYDPRGKDNEDASKEYAERALSGLLETDSMNRISRWIMSTKHDHPVNSMDEKLIMDIDLAILGRDEQTFEEYEKGVRMEYGWVPEDRFSKGRTEILNGFLERDSLYQTVYFREKYEEKARENLHHSISLLKIGN